MIRVAVASLKGHFVRFLMTALAVSLGVAFVVGSGSMTKSLDNTFVKLIGDTSATTDAQIQAVTAPGGFEDNGPPTAFLPLDFEQKIEAVSGVRYALPDRSGSAILVSAQETAVRRATAPTLAFAYTPEDPMVTLINGRAPERAGEVAVEKETLKLSGHQVGADTSAIVNGERVDVKIVGEFESGGTAGATVVLFDRASAEKFFLPNGETTSFSVRAQEGVSQEQLVENLKPIIPEGFEVVTGKAYVEKQTKELRSELSFVTVFLGIFATVSVIVGGFIIVNTFLMLLGQRTQELAMLRAIGTRKRQVMGMVLVEALLVGVLGSVLGFGLGLVLSMGLVALMGTFGLELSMVPVITPASVVSALVVGVGVTFIAALIPAFKASRVAPVAAMRSEVTTARKPLKVRGVCALALFALGVALAVVSLMVKSGGMWVAAVASGVLLIAFIVGSAPAVKGVIGFLSAPFVRAGAVSRMASENAVRNPRRTALTAGALMIGLALVSAVGVLASSTTASVKEQTAVSMKADFAVNSGWSGVPASLTDKLSAVDGVKHSTAVRFTEATFSADGVEKDVSLVGTRLKDYSEAYRFELTQGTGNDVGENELMVSEKFAEQQKLNVGDSVKLSFGTLTDHEVKIVGVYKNSSVFTSGVISEELLSQAVPVERQMVLVNYLTLDAGADPAVVQRKVEEVVKPLIVVSVQDREAYAEAQTGDLNQVLYIIYALLALSIVIAALGVANTLAMSLFERTREVGMLRAVGLKRGQLSRMVIAESVWTALFGAVTGVVLGLGLGLLLQRHLVSDGLDVLGVPWVTIGVVMLVSALVGVVAALVPAFRAARINILKAIAS